MTVLWRSATWGLIVLCASGSDAGAQPPNDACAAPTVISSWPYATTQDTTTATTEPSDPRLVCSNNQQNHKSVWYELALNSAGTAIIDTKGATYGAVTSVYTGACGALAVVSCVVNVLHVPIPWRPLIFSPQAGTKYLIEIADFYGDGVGSGGTLPVSLSFFKWTFKPAPGGDRGLNKIRVDPNDDNLWYVGSTSNGLHITRDGGNTWERHLAGLSWGLAIDPTNANRVYAGSGTNIYRSEDKGRTWSLMNTFASGAAVYSILVSSIDGSVFVGMHFGTGTSVSGMYRSTDRGQTWTFNAFNIPALPDNQHTNLITWTISEDPVNGFIYAGTEPAVKPPCMPGCYDPPTLRSKDRGLTWQDISGTVGAPGALGWHATAIQVHPLTRHVYHQNEGGRVYVSTDFGDTWQMLGANASWDLLLDPRNPSRFFAGGAGTPRVWMSTDTAQSFLEIGPPGLTGRAVMHVAMNGSSTRLYVSYSGVNPGGVWVADLAGSVFSPPTAPTDLRITP